MERELKKRKLLSIGVDCDDVLADYVPALIEYCELKEGRKLPFPTAWSFASQWGISDEDLEQYMRSFAVEGSFRWVKPIPMAVDYLSQIQDRGHTIKIITARSHLANISPLLRRKIVSDTSAWLEHHHFDYDELHFTERKSEIPFDVLIDDGPRHLTDAYHVGRDVIVISRAYNSDFHNGAAGAHGIYRASTWWDIYDTILELEGK